MAKDAIPASAIEAVKAATDVGGAKEINALTKELNNMSLSQLQALNKEFPAIQAAEAKNHPGLPSLTFSIESHGTTDTTNEIKITRPDIAASNSPVQRQLNQFGLSHVEPQLLYYRGIGENGKTVTADVQFSAMAKEILRDYRYDPEKHVSTEQTTLPDGTKKIVTVEPGLTTTETNDPVRKIDRITNTDGVRQVTMWSAHEARTLTLTPGKKDVMTVRTYSTTDTYIDPAGKTQHTRKGPTGLEEMDFKDDDGKVTTYTRNDKNQSILVDKELPNGTRVHEEFLRNGAMKDGYVQKKGDWWPTKLAKQQESEADVKALIDTFGLH